ncbi:hypothetical protein [Sphaerisporangium aureirubrum]|uniref:Uncharacterized protein n=1 Tax=Sphaerisporangium aureirubrum TaxID=1544736 RepID=A0ABW1NVU2_9ACTN
MLAVLATMAALAALGPAVPALADDRVVCRVTFVVTTGPDGIRDDTILTVSLGDQAADPVDLVRTFIFEDSDGDGTPDPGGGTTFRRGGTGDRPHTTFTWHARLRDCVSDATLRQGFLFKQITAGDDWDLQGLRVVDRDEPRRVYFDRPAADGPVHRFGDDPSGDGTWSTTQRDVNAVCRVTITVSTGGDGLRDDSEEHVSLGGQRLIFEDWNGDGRVDPYVYENADGEPGNEQPGGVRYHNGGTGDLEHATFTWHARLAPCLPLPLLGRGLEIRHVNRAEDWRADNWDMTGFRLVDRDTRRVYADRPASGTVIHRFEKNANQTWHTPIFPVVDPDPALDTDHDGLTDRVELFGKLGEDGLVDRWLPDHGADPCRKTLAVEIDWFEAGDVSDRPSRAAMDEAVDMFDEAPVDAPETCPYAWGATPGVQLLTDLSNGLTVTPEERETPLNVPDPVTGRTPFDELREDHFTPGREGVFFYNLWGYTHNGLDSSGTSGLGPRENDFVVTLGNVQDPTDRAQAATFVHELGHVLGLGHGGGDHANFKPNHLSVMNYRYSTIGVPDMSAWRATLARMPQGTDFDPATQRAILESVSHIDYSDTRLPTLRRDALPEVSGIGAFADSVAAWWDPSRTLRVGDARQGLDWDFSAGGVPDPVAAASVDVMSGFQVCVAPRTPAGQPAQPVVATPVDDDEPFEGKIIAGRDGECDTPAVPGQAGDLQVEDPGVHYPTKYGYQNGVTGFDDWEHILFRIGDTPESHLPLSPPDPGIGAAEDARNVARLFEALTAAATPTVPAPRWGYAYMNEATPAVGVPVPLNHVQWTTGRRDPATAGHRASVTRTGTGEYEVRLPDVGAAGGMPHVTAFRTTYRGRTCAVAGYGQDGPDETVRVRCLDQAGAPIDWWFTIFFAAATPGGAPYATVRYDRPGGTADLAPVVNDGTFNSEGRVDDVRRTGTGRYTVTLHGPGFAADSGYVQITPYGTGTPARCHPEGTTPVADGLEVAVGCYAVGAGPETRADSPWLLSYIRDGGLHHDPSVPAAYLTTTGDPAAPSVDPRHSWSSTGETPSVTRLGAGHYRVIYDGIGKPWDNVQVSSNSPGRYCFLGTFASYSRPPELLVDVYCHNTAGLPADSLFGFAYVRGY